MYAKWNKNSGGGSTTTYFYFAIEKVDAQDGHALNDAKFELYQRDSRDNKLPSSRKTTVPISSVTMMAMFTQMD